MKRVLLASYGGGHVRSLIPVAHQLRAVPWIDLTVIGFTTARAAFKRAGIDAIGYDSLVSDRDGEWLSAVEPFLPSASHPDVSAEETRAYFGLGFKNLALEYGDDEAGRLMRSDGRKAFLPVTTFADYIDTGGFDLVITSTSPRSELAVQRAARRLGVPGLAVSDLFLQMESEYICRTDYAQDVSVISPFVAEFLRSRELPEGHRTHVVGNPAFDELDDEAFSTEAAEVRESMAIPQSIQLLTWIGSTGKVSLIGKEFLSTAEVVDWLESFCRSNPAYKYMLRRHPSDDCNVRLGPHGMLCPDIPIETCIQLSDLLLMETSTVGLQAALLEKPVVTIGADDYPPYAELGVAVDVPNLDSAAAAIHRARPPDLARLGYPSRGAAADSVAKLATGILTS